jgi:hypothetical protein
VQCPLLATGGIAAVFGGRVDQRVRSMITILLGTVPWVNRPIVVRASPSVDLAWTMSSTSEHPVAITLPESASMSQRSDTLRA